MEEEWGEIYISSYYILDREKKDYFYIGAMHAISAITIAIAIAIAAM